MEEESESDSQKSNTLNTYLSAGTSPAYASSKHQNTESHLTANVICKITMQRCLLFDIQSRYIEQAFTQIKAPDGIKSKVTLVLTSSEHMLLLGGEDKGTFLSTNLLFNLAN